MLKISTIVKSKLCKYNSDPFQTTGLLWFWEIHKHIAKGWV